MPLGRRERWINRGAGERNRAVRIEQMTESTVDGSTVETWTTLIASLFMHRRDVTGAERFRDAQVSAKYDTEWSMPYVTTMDPEAIDVPKYRRLVYRGRTYGIVTAILGEQRSEIVLMTLASSRV